MKTISASGAKKTRSLIVKTYTKSEAAALLLREFRQFHKEVEAFRTILPLMENLMDEFRDLRSTLWPKMLGYIPHHQIVFTDLNVCNVNGTPFILEFKKWDFEELYRRYLSDIPTAHKIRLDILNHAKNYVLMDRKSWQGLEHAYLVLRSLGRFHAMGKVLLERGLIEEEDKSSYFLATGSTLQRKVLEGCILMLSDALINKKGSWPVGWEEIGARLANQVPLIGRKMESLYECSNAAFNVFNHGDLWSSNMMFRVMEYTNLPVSVKFLDYQLTHISSFVWDINHYIYTSVRPSIRRKHQAQLLTAYHTSLSDNLGFFGYGGYTPSLNDVMSEFDRTLPAGFALVASILPMASGTPQEPFRLDQLATKPPEEAFDNLIFSEEKYVQEICGDLEFFVRNSII